MKKIKAAFIDSAEELKKINTFTTCAMLGAISIVFGYFSIQVGNFIKIDFADLPIELGACLFGPVVGPIMGVVMDIINYMVKPTGEFYLGFTLSAVVRTLIIGILLYKKPVDLKRIIIATFISTLIVDMGMNTIWLSNLYSKAIYVILPVRILKSLILWPIQAGFLYILMKALHHAKHTLKIKVGD